MTRGVSSFLASTNSPLRLLVCCFLLLLSHSVAGLAQPLAHAPARVRAFTRDAHLMGSHFTFTAVSADDMLAWQAIWVGIGEAQRIDWLCSYLGTH